MKRWLGVVFAVAFLTACQGLPLPGITAVAPITNVGDEAETITNINNAPDTFWWILMILGWIAPSPQEIFRGVGNFLLRLFKRNPL